MEDFDLGANFPSIVNASTVSSDAVVFGESFPDCLSGSDYQKPEEVLEKEFSLPEGCGLMLLSDDIMRPCVSAAVVEHSILSETDFPGAEISSSFASPQDSSAIRSLRRVEPSDTPPLSSGAVLPTNLSILASSDLTGIHVIQDPTFDFDLISMNTPEVTSSPLLKNATYLESFLSPGTNVEDISSSGGSFRMPIPQGLQMDILFVKPESGIQCVSGGGAGLSSQESTVSPSQFSALSPTRQAMNLRFSGISDHFGPTISGPSFSNPLAATGVSNVLPLRASTTCRQWNIVENATGKQSLPQTRTSQGSMKNHKETVGQKSAEPSLSIAFPNITKANPEKVKEHACGICGISFAAKCNLFKHQRAVHLGLRPYSCSLCVSAFSERNKLQKHVLTVHRLERNHKCGLCETRFGQKSDLRRHVQVVHEQQKNFGCEICGRAFGRRSSLSQHMQRVHSRKLPSLRESGRANVSSANRPDRGEVAMKKSEKMTDSAAVSEELQTAKSFDFGSICFE